VATLLYDAGVIIASLVRTDSLHLRAIALLKRETGSLLTTWPCFTEAMYLCAEYGGTPAQQQLRNQYKRRLFTLADLSLSDADRACDLMERYADAPMDFADASLVVTAENTGITRILTFDRHFYAYRINGKTHFDVVA
jgi:predicted nucleic acid-binding protein